MAERHLWGILRYFFELYKLVIDFPVRLGIDLLLVLPATFRELFNLFVPTLFYRWVFVA